MERRGSEMINYMSSGTFKYYSFIPVTSPQETDGQTDRQTDRRSAMQ